MTTGARPLRTVSWVLGLAMVALAVATYGGLPEQVPTHLALDGTPDAWTPRRLGTWLLLPGLGVGLLAAFEGLARAVVARPHLVNVPDRERLIAMPPAWRAPAMLEVLRLLDLAAVVTLAIMGTVQVQLVEVAHGRAGLPAVVLLIAPFALTLPLLLSLVRIGTAIDDAHRAWTAAGAPAE